MKRFDQPRHRRLSLFNVALAHGLVLLQVLTPCTYAGDILRMNAGGGAAPAAGGSTTPGAGAVDTSAAAAQARHNAQDMLARNTMALQAVDAMQAAARAAAAGANNAGANPNFPGQTLPDVPNGLGVGGLDFISGTGAAAPVSSTQTDSMNNIRNIVTIQQQQQQAMLEWKTFNIGRETTLRFDQSAGGADAGSWIAFNRVTDPTGNPSQILGSIEAQGQVYVINQNGIIFGGSSVVNTHTLVASALPINDNLITRGLLNNPDSQFLFSANPQAAGTNGPTPAYTPPSPPASGRIGNVTVQAGARITSPTSSANVGGRVALIGPNVTNEGTISTPDGQVILAAGMEVGFEAHSSDDPSLRGLDVYVGSVGSYGGTATNNGLIEAPRGSVVIAGKEVNQNGFISSTTSAALNGRVDLLANYNAVANVNYGRQAMGGAFVYQSGNSTGIVSTGTGSVIQILPEYASSLKVVGTGLALKSQVNMQGLGIHLGMDSVVLAPNADVAISAGVWDLVMSAGSITDLDFAQVGGQVYVDQGAVVNVAGSTAIASSISQYIVTVDLRAAELADSALQRNGSLRGESITVDLREHGVREDGTEWVGTPLADLTGYLGVIERNAGELTVAGGNITIKAGGSVVVQDGAVLDVSGGYQNFAAAYIATSRLLHNGNIIDIADARADILYDGIFTPSSSTVDPRWGTTTTSTVPFADAGHEEAAHSVGADAGSIHLDAPAMALDGSLVGRAITGPQQLESAPQNGTLSLYFRAQQPGRLPLDLPYYYPTPPDITFSNGASGLPAAAPFSLDGSGAPAALRQERQDTMVLSPTLLSSQGFGSLLISNPEGNITVPTGVAVTTPLAGSVTLEAANIDIQGSITAPAGTISLTAHDISPYAVALLGPQGGAAVVPPADPSRGHITLGTAARLSTAGTVVDDRAASPARGAVPLDVRHLNADGTTSLRSTMAGGSVSMTGYVVELAVGSLVDVSGGFMLGTDGAVTYADAGAITLKAGRDPLIASLVGGHLTLGGTLAGFSGASGGDLTLLAPVIQVGGAALHADALVLQPDFFNQGGFDSFSLTGLGIDVTAPGGAETYLPGIFISAGTTIRPQVRSLQVTADGDGGEGSVSVETLLRPEGYRPAVSIEFLAPGLKEFASNELAVRGAIVAEAGSVIETDALGSVSFEGQLVELLGSVTTPGGTITVAAAAQYPQDQAPTTAYATLHLGSSSRLSTAGKTVLLQDPYGRRTGHVYGGGLLSVSGNIVADAGAVLDVSGTSAVLDLLPEQSGVANVFTAGLVQASLFPGNGVTRPVELAQTVATQIDSNGGTLVLKGGELLFSNATLLGQAGGSSARGGTLIVSSDRFVAPGAANDDKDMTLLVAQNMAQFTQPVFGGGAVLGKALADSAGSAIRAIGYFGADSFASGGFDSLTLGGNTQFVGAVNITAAAALKVATGGVLMSNDLVRLTAPYVALGQQLAPPTRDEELINPFMVTLVATTPSYFSPTYGSGRLEVNADLIETGFLSLQNIGQASLTARQDLRGSGYFDMAGQLTITAGQVYPVTASTFTITAYDYTVGGVGMQGSVTIASSGFTPEFPLAGGGRLNIYASSITQGGTLRAPLGSIRLGWDGTGTAPKGLVTNLNVPVTQQLTLQNGSVTSVSAIDPQTGAAVNIPYGILKDGTNWIDPTGFDITSTGAPDKSIRVSAANVITEAGSTVDIRGGGELYGYRWVEGNGGTTDILDTNGSYAILPGYAAFFAPFAPYATAGLYAPNLGGDTGYTHSGISIGDRIYLQAAPGVAEGVYTLLPARYALLPGALLVTPDSSPMTASQTKPDGAALTSGYLFNSLNPNATSRIFEQFEVAPRSVVTLRAEYESSLASSFIPAAQQRLSLPTTVTSHDAGYALLGALQTMQLNGGVTAAGVQGGRGGRVDISSPLDIVLAAPGAPTQAGKLVLNTTLLSGWNTESLLIGGERVSGNGTSTVTVRSTNVTLDNAGAPLTGVDIVLAAKEKLTLASGSVLSQTGTQTAADAFVIAGNGALVRVSGVAAAQTSRTGVTASVLPEITVNANALVSGVSITLDSTNATNLNPAALLTGSAVSLNSGRISIQLDNPGALQAGAGLVLGASVLGSLQHADILSLLSYSALDIYGTGTLTASGVLALRAGEIRGFNNGGGTVSINAQGLVLDNLSNGSVPGAVTGMSGTLRATAATIVIGQNALTVDQFSNVVLNATSSLRLQGAGSFATQGALQIITPYITGASGTIQSVVAGAELTLANPGASGSTPAGLQLGAQVSFSGTSVTADTDILLPSGALTLRARTGDLNVGGRLDVGGTAAWFYDVIKYTDGGAISLAADAGAVTVNAGSTVNVSAAAGGGDAGTFGVYAPAGLFTMNGVLLGTAGAGGTAGAAEIDVGSLASFTALNDLLNMGAFNASRNLRVRNGDVVIDGTVNAHRFLLGVDHGSITVNGTINASGKTGGRIDLIASGSVVLASGAVLSVAGQEFDSAGKGGAVWLEAGSYVNGASSTSAVLDVRAGSTIDLSVAAKTGASAQHGQFTGTLHLRAPQSAGNTEVTAIQAIGGTIQNASSIVVEGYKVYDLTGSGDISTTVQNSIQSNGVSFGGNSAAISTRLLTGNANAAALSPLLVVMPGAEVVNRTGSLTLGSASSPVAADWNLATFRYGPKNAPGVLTLRAAGNLEFYNTLSDGFNVLTSVPATYTLVERMWLATLTAQNTNLPVNTQSWTYRMAAGADFSAANFREVVALEDLAANTGSLLLGKDAGQAVPASPGDNVLTRQIINPTNGSNVNTTANRFQVIRTGTGDIEIFTGRDVQLLNQFATIYTAGVSVPSATTVFSAGDFVLPLVTQATSGTPVQVTGALQQPYAPQYSLAGGNVTVNAGADIVHLTKDAGGNLIADSQRELPNNWLMRRGYVDGTGTYGVTRVSSGGLSTVNDAASSTTWWVNFSNFFDGVAALGGGNVTLKAGRDVQNVSAHAPTNARATRGIPSAATLLELGGGDVTVSAGRNIDGGVYYVERGLGILNAGGRVTTNSTRSPSLGRLGATPSIYPEETWLPTTLFAGRSSFEISARGDVLLGPVANTMLLPQGINNKHWYKTYFSTYGEDAAVRVTSLGGNITIRQAATLPQSGKPDSLLYLWMTNELLLTVLSTASYQPWLRLVETSVAPFATLSTLMPGTLQATAYSGDITLVGKMILSPSPQGTLELLAAGSVNGLAPTGLSSGLVTGSQLNVWTSASINVSDANPDSIPGMLTPFAYYQTYFDPSVSLNNSSARTTSSNFLVTLDSTFAESGSTTGAYASTQLKQRLHAAGLLHANDTQPVRIYAAGGDLSGLVLFAPKPAVILAQRDITDIALYIQNLHDGDLSIVSSGRDIVAYNANSVLRSLALSAGNGVAAEELPRSGDIQISGPGTLQVLAGRDLNLGTGSNNADGTGVGIASIGNGRNPYLPFAGADIIAGAGMGSVAVGLGGSAGQFDGFINALLTSLTFDAATWPADQPLPYLFNTRRYFAELVEQLHTGGLRGLPASILVHDPAGPEADLGAEVGAAWLSAPSISPGGGASPSGQANSINLNDPALTAEQRNQLGLALYFLALRDAGRDRNNPSSPDVNTYAAGYEAIQALFPVSQPAGVTFEQIVQMTEHLYPNHGGIQTGTGPSDPEWAPGRDPGTLYGIALLQDRARPLPSYPFSGSIQTQARDIRTKSGGNISIFTPGGGLEMASTLIGETLAPPGIITESGGNISIFADQDVSIGIARIFTLRGGDINIWSSVGNIAAGSSSKTVQSAPPTRVLIDPQSANVATDLAGLATGGGIGVLATVADIAPGNVDLIAPVGAVDAGDAGIRATGNLNIAANVVLNPGNIVVGGSAAGTPAASAVASPSLGAVSSAATAGAATTAAVKDAAPQQSAQQAAAQETPSIITVEVIGYGGGTGDDDDERRRNQPGE